MTPQRAKLEKIAQDLLGLDTIETRNSDSLDFSEQAVWNIRAALNQAYAAGRTAGKIEQQLNPTSQGE